MVHFHSPSPFVHTPRRTFLHCLPFRYPLEPVLLNENPKGGNHYSPIPCTTGFSAHYGVPAIQLYCGARAMALSAEMLSADTSSCSRLTTTSTSPLSAGHRGALRKTSEKIAGDQQRNGARRLGVHSFFVKGSTKRSHPGTPHARHWKGIRSKLFILKNDPLTGQLVDYRHKEERQWQKER